MGRGKRRLGSEGRPALALASSRYATPAEVATKLDDLASSYDDLGALFAEEMSWDEPGYTAEGGAAVFSVMLRRAGIEHEYCSGVFYWGEEKADIFRELQAGDDSGADLEEQHCWIEITDARLREPLLFDPNGEKRGEPRLQARVETLDRYDPYESLTFGSSATVNLSELAGWGTAVSSVVAALADSAVAA